MSLSLMEVRGQKEEELLTAAINYTVIQNSFLTEAENNVALAESMIITVPFQT